jgi:hypothetical protein
MQLSLPFAAKELPTGEKLYKREHGIRSSVSSGSNDILWTVPYNWAKIVGVEIVNGSVGDYCDFYVLDTTTGTYYGVANAVLNRFGYEVNISPEFYQSNSTFAADLYLNMQLKLVYNSVSSKTIGINFNLTEVKS